MDSHPKKKKKKKKTNTEQIRNQSTVTSLAEKTKYNLYRAKENQTPLPNTTIQICLSKKKKKTQYRANQTPNPEKTKPTVRRSHRSQAQLAPSLVVLVQSLSLVRPSSLLRACPSLSFVACPSSQIVDRRSQISLGCSDAQPQGISLSFSL